MNILIEPHYFPSLEYFCAIAQHDFVFIEQYEYFVKQTLRNRCYINTSQGIKILSVPLENRHGKILSKEVKVEPGNRWKTNHWRTLQSAYRNSPYFEFYADDLEHIFFKTHTFLIDFNFELLSFCLKTLKWKKPIEKTSSYQEIIANTTDSRSQITDRKPFALRNFYRPHSYTQVFGSEFVPNLSVVDLLFCVGPRASEVLYASLGC